MKEKLSNILGGAGVVLYYLFRLIVPALPFVMIGTKWWLTAILFLVQQFFPPLTIVIWGWGLVCAIQGVQDVWAIAYYVLFVIMFLPFFISTILSIFEKK